MFPVAVPYPGGALGTLTANGRVFQMDSKAWRWHGATAFAACDRFGRGESLEDLAASIAGAQVWRVFSYTPVADWGYEAWESPDLGTLLAFLQWCAARGILVEFTLLTDDDPSRIEPARQLVEGLAAARPSNVVLEIGNEPTTHKTIITEAIHSTCEASGLLYSSGDYEDSSRFFGRFLTCHTARDAEWPRRAHDLLEYYQGGGPNAPSDPAHHVPCVADEPIRPDQAGYNLQDFRAYFGACALLGAGATFHAESLKYAQPLSSQEAACFAAALEGLRAFPADAPLGAYRRIAEKIDPNGSDNDPANFYSLRTYVVGDYMVRIRPKVPEAYEPGWRMLDDAGILWSR